jgi:hypothetical protein
MGITTILFTVAGSITALGVIIAALKKSARLIRRIVHLTDELIGNPASDGLPGSPGISSRLAAIEYELKPNSGKSLRDKIDRLETWTIGHSLIHADLAEQRRVSN